ncbi:amidohydrolase family protein [Humibacter antri]
MGIDSERIVLRGGAVVDAPADDTIGEEGAGTKPPRLADVAIERGVIVAVGDVEPRAGDHVIDCGRRLVLPGFVDAHSHADALLADEQVQRALLKQGVTTVIAGQDGVSYAPGDGTYAAEYFAAIDGAHPTYRGGGVAGYLSGVGGASRLNAAYLVPAGTVRFQVCGRSQEPATPDRLKDMIELVAQGMREGAVGLSTGLDYVPGVFQSTEEIAALCEPVAAAGGVYVSHMRGGYEANASAGIHEMQRIAELVRERTGHALPVHVSHFHADADIVLRQLDELAQTGTDATFDAYPYTRGCSLLGMPLLPPELSVHTVDEVVHALGDQEERDRLRREWFPRVAQNASLGPDWPHMLTLAHLAAPKLAWAHGLTIAEAAQRAGADPVDFALDVLLECRLEANVVMAVRHARPISELARIFSHPNHLGGSDGIFIGARPHPRTRGTFARFLREYVRETASWTWPDAVQHLSHGAVTRFGLGDRGVVRRGAVADLIVVDPRRAADTATYEEPLREAVGIDDVLVAGVPVLAGGELTDARPGRGLKRTSSASAVAPAALRDVEGGR